MRNRSRLTSRRCAIRGATWCCSQRRARHQYCARRTVVPLRRLFTRHRRAMGCCQSEECIDHQRRSGGLQSAAIATARLRMDRRGIASGRDRSPASVTLFNMLNCVTARHAHILGPKRLPTWAVMPAQQTQVLDGTSVRNCCMSRAFVAQRSTMSPSTRQESTGASIGSTCLHRKVLGDGAERKRSEHGSRGAPPARCLTWALVSPPAPQGA
jgi:hypothetical protein